uniref:UBC core domain-containing protein n=1 Tax=Helicotheca tamesis TaxID=374047 RepID=A0A7S2HDG1_9STRA|mmetsp:Transcript_17174/g.23595  ORF Transcript_17174/g.23595 Transcript_17174/m.23595 type:complete len:695 (+) Transcript_17174:81-2165(+)
MNERNNDPENELDIAEDDSDDEENNSMSADEGDQDDDLEDDVSEYEYADSDMDEDDADIAFEPSIKATKSVSISAAEANKSKERRQGNIKLLDRILGDCNDAYPVPVSQDDEEFLSLITADKKRPRVSTGSTNVSATTTGEQTKSEKRKGTKKSDDCSTSTLKPGVGYERGDFRSTSDLVNRMEAAEKKQLALDKTCCSLLKELYTFFDEFDGDEGIVLLSLKMSRGLNRMLFSILKNDSFLDLGKRSGVYLSTLDFLDRISSSKFLSSFLVHDLLEGDGSGHSEGETSCESLLAALHQQADVLGKHQEKILNDVHTGKSTGKLSDEESVARNSIVVCNKMKNTLENVTSAIKLGRQAGTISEVNDGAFLKKQTTPSSEKTDSEGIPLVEKEGYCKEMSKYRFDSVSMLELIDKNVVSYYFHDKVGKGAQAGDVLPQRMLRIHSEVAGLSRDLPVEWGSSIFVRIDEERPDVMKALIMAPEGTPYENGVFEFDIRLPDNYPNDPPLVQFVTTNKNQTRFNPNLYNSGKVCLSLLGTWQGPGWIPKTSTVLQVLISIQSLIFVPDPYFNEPGYDPSSDDAKRNSKVYDNQIRAATLKFAIFEQLEKPPIMFRDCVANHFRLKKRRILKQLAEWEELAKECETKSNKAKTSGRHGYQGLVAGGGIRPDRNVIKETCSKIEKSLQEKFPDIEKNAGF